MQDGVKDPWEELAHKYWLQRTPRKLKPENLKTEIWAPLEHDSFSLRSLVTLENLQILERFLWPTFSPESPNQHVLLIAIFFNVKQRGHLQSWSIFSDRPDDFSTLSRRVLSLSLDSSLSAFSRLTLLNFVIGAFQSLEKDFVRREVAPLVSISIWHNLHSPALRDRLTDSSPARRKAWKAAQKRFDAADAESKARLKFDRAWLFSITLDFLNKLNTALPTSTEDITYCEKFLEFLTDLISQLPTRRFTNDLFKDLNVVAVLKTSKLYVKDENALFRDLVSLFEHFSTFQIDDQESAGVQSHQNAHYQNLARLQKTAMTAFESKLKLLALSNYASISKRNELQSHFDQLTDNELINLCTHLDLRTTYPASVSVPVTRRMLLELLLSTFSTPPDFQHVVQHMPISPREDCLYDPKLLRNEGYDGTKPLPIPKLNLQYLTLEDFMWRSFQLHQAESFYGIRKDLESIARRMKPRQGRDGASVVFEGFSTMALPIDKPAMIEVGTPKVGAKHPSFVRSEVILDVSRLNDSIRQEWDNLRPKDVVFLLCVKPAERNSGSLTNGNASTHQGTDDGILRLRTAEVVQVLDDNGRPVRSLAATNGYGPRPKRRRLLIDMDPVAYQADKDRTASGKPDIYASLNVISRRQGRENNFKPVLETVQKLVGTNASLPSWFQDVFLGYGDPKSASIGQISDRIESVDFLDTFLDWNHLISSFPTRTVQPSEGKTEDLSPPFILELFATTETTAPTNPKKRRREQMEESESQTASVQVSTYQPKNTGPYPTDVPKRNIIRFTQKQTEAIVSGTQPGLTIIVGPPGTGKTDVATQIINLLYHNFPSERVLLIAHSNQALNQLFQKIMALDIDPRHLLRLGHGEEELDTEASYSKYGRVESFLENRQSYLLEVTRLANSIDAQGAHGNTCETADYFNQVYIKPAWSQFWDIANDDTTTTEQLAHAFPFHKFFSNAPIPELFPSELSIFKARAVAEGCQYHIDKIFTELEAIRPFEILRNNRDQANHLLVKEARIIAMTSTHAAMRRSEIADLGFHYDTLVMEEAAQITEIESFIPCALQNPDPKTGQLPLKRIVLVGDHLQNSPVIQNMALRQYANFEQSLFLRLVRLGVPTINLDQQGRCRPSLARLFSWRYPGLTNLPHLTLHPEFHLANPGLRHTYQFINVPDYQDQGEREPSPHFIQNLGEAEYAVALYQYMRLLGYPARNISILATYAGQRALIRDVLDHRCKNHNLFGLPRIVTTVDKYQGEQNDFVILSLVRTKNVGYLRDVRRLTVALSRARLGLYVLGRKSLWENCFEFRPAMDILEKRPDKLVVVTGEMYPTTRVADDEGEENEGEDGESKRVVEVQGVEMDGVEHLGQYVFEMTQAKVKSMGGKMAVLQDAGAMDAEDGVEGGVVDEGVDEVDEGDPLHEAA